MIFTGDIIFKNLNLALHEVFDFVSCYQPNFVQIVLQGVVAARNSLAITETALEHHINVMEIMTVQMPVMKKDVVSFKNTNIQQL